MADEKLTDVTSADITSTCMSYTGMTLKEIIQTLTEILLTDKTMNN